MNGCFSNRIDELAMQIENKYANSKTFYFPCPLCGLPPCVAWILGWVFQTEMVQIKGKSSQQSNLEIPLMGVLRCLCFDQFQI